MQTFAEQILKAKKYQNLLNQIQHRVNSVDRGDDSKAEQIADDFRENTIYGNKKDKLPKGFWDKFERAAAEYAISQGQRHMNEGY